MDFRATIVIVAISTCVVLCQIEEVQQVLKTSSRKYCGSHLAQALSAICRGNYNTLRKNNPYTKRHAQFESSETMDDPEYPFKKRADASLLSNYAKRRKRGAGKGVYNECCEKSCSREELSSYCAASRRRRR
ncbi:unnamed protein product [Acanthoscelides obtectus]|uniref:Insulin-like domain-containing protein n=1 Tax=Acanthoscelides obtectus TaxID=200917 RepID=A0A9P0PK40_ACAOB|nr:unnamed protein product [Acanthoscelides obtectus]CAK1631213.1 hypothetical protein AOBTE_LOCUS6817 [Acanthoscelides obtectus]